MSKYSIDYKNIIRGESSSDWLPDRGFSPVSYGLNLTKTKGVLYFAPDATTLATAPTGNMIASADDRNYLGNDKYFLDDEGAVYTLSGTTLTKRQTSASTFVVGTSDMLQFNLSTYYTSTDSLHESTGSDLATCERIWGGALNSSFRHPLEIIEDEMFVANKNVIFFLNNAGTTGTAFTLPNNVNVTSLRKHPDGRTLLAFCGTTGDLNGARTRAGKGYVYYCNPLLRDWTREVEIQSQIEGSRLVGGIVYVTWGKKFGYFNGDGLSPIKYIETSATTYSHAMSNMEDILLLRDGLNLKAYGDLGVGNVWWNIFKTATQNINCVAYKGDNKVLVAFSDGGSAGVLQQIDYDDAGVAGIFVGNREFFGDKVHIDRIEMLHDQTDTAGTTAFSVHQRGEAGGINLSNDKRHGQIEAISYVNQSIYETFISTDILATNFQFYLAPVTDNIGFQEVRIYYEPDN